MYKYKAKVLDIYDSGKRQSRYPNYMPNNDVKRLVYNFSICSNGLGILVKLG